MKTLNQPSITSPAANRKSLVLNLSHSRLAMMVVVSLCLRLCLCSAIALGAPSLADRPVPEGLSASDWSSIREAYEAGLHAIHRQDDGTHTARNPGQRWRTEFDGRGFLVKPDHGQWTWGMELRACRDQDLQSATPHVAAHGNTLTYHWGNGIEEWFRNDRRGLEQGWTIHAGSADGSSASAGLTLSFKLRGPLRPQISADQRSVIFQTTDGATALTYRGLKAWDAKDKALPARFVPGEDKASLAVVVDDANATYPITIDPVAQQEAFLKAGLSDPKAQDSFGYSVAVSGITVVVGAPGEDSSATTVNGDESDNSASNSGAVYVFKARGVQWFRQAYLKASNGEALDQFGYSVAISGDTVVVGALGEDSSATTVNGDGADNSAGNTGAAYVFVRDGTDAWSEEAYLKASNSGAGDVFGNAVAISGDTVVVGANLEDSSATTVNGSGAGNSAESAGAAYVFLRSGTSWAEEAYLKPTNTGAGDQFGASVGISGETIVVGADEEDSAATGVNGNQGDDSATSSGAAYVFARNGTTWSQEAYLKASNTEAFDLFGLSVAISGETVVVGAREEDSSATGVNGNDADNSLSGSGAAFVFVRDPLGTWSQEAYLKASNSGGDDQFGQSVAISGDRLVVGAYREDGEGDAASDSGAAYVFVRSGTTWSEQIYLKASNAGAGDRFGFAVGISGSVAIAGAFREDGSGDSAENSGAAYLFARNLGVWGERTLFKATDNGVEDQFGWSVAISGNTAVVGAYLEDSAATGVDGNSGDNSAEDSGAAYVFVRSGTAWSQQAYLKASNTGAGDAFGFSVSVSGDIVVVGAPREDSAATEVDGNGSDNSAVDSGAAYVFVRSGTTWSHQSYLKASNTGANDQFGRSVAISGWLGTSFKPLVVGAPLEDGLDDGGSNSGAAYVFVPTSTSWRAEAYLKASNAEGGDGFGASVAIWDETLVVGADDEDSAATGVNGDESDNSATTSGAAYVFVRNSASQTWSQQAYLKASNTGPFDRFGKSVAISGGTVVVGAREEDSTATGVNGDQSDNSASASGAAYVFYRSLPDNNWTQQAYLKASNAEAGDQFGYSVAIFGDSVVVGAPLEASAAAGVNGDGSDNSAGASGAAYLFVRSGTAWGQEAYFKASNPDANDFFGFSVAISDTTVVVGARAEDSAAAGPDSDGSDNTGGYLTGAAYVFDTLYGPELRVEQPIGRALLSDDSTVDFGAHPEGDSGVREFRIANIGALTLTGIVASIEGPNASDFTVTAVPSGTVIPRGSTTLTVRFTAASAPVAETRSATLLIASNDDDENPFTIALTSAVLSFATDSDGDGLNDVSEFQLADLGFDWEVNQTALVDTLFGNLAGALPNLNAEGFYTTAQVQALYAPAPFLARHAGTGKFTLTMDWMKSTDLENFFDFRADAPGSSVSVNPATGDIEFEFDSIDEAAFFRVEVD